MNTTLRNVLSVIAGLFGGGFLNMGIILISAIIIPPPAGVDVTTTDGLKAGMQLFTPINFLMPFLAHALGTLVGCWICSKLAASRFVMLS